MSTDRLAPNDPRVTHNDATIRGKTYHYIVAKPPADKPARGTILLIHGFPDLGFGWRYQVPLLANELGLQVIVPDMLGYGGTDAPHDPAPYAFKSVCADLVALVDHVGVVGGDAEKRFFVGGHDWGGAVAWRLVLWHAARLRAVFSVCTPFFAPSAGAYQPTEAVVQLLPNFRYQLQCEADELWQSLGKDPVRLRAFLHGLYGGRIPPEKLADPAQSPLIFDTAHGVDLARLLDVGPSPLLTAAEIDYYAAQYARNGLRGPTNWYRTRRHNWEDERELAAAGAATGDNKITLPTLMVVASSDEALPPIMSSRMDVHFTNLTKREVPGSHWLLWQSADAVNKEIQAFLGPLVGVTPTGKSSL